MTQRKTVDLLFVHVLSGHLQRRKAGQLLARFPRGASHPKSNEVLKTHLEKKHGQLSASTRSSSYAVSSSNA
jgi:hypothetical protein